MTNRVEAELPYNGASRDGIWKSVAGSLASIFTYWIPGFAEHSDNFTFPEWLDFSIRGASGICALACLCILLDKSWITIEKSKSGRLRAVTLRLFCGKKYWRRINSLQKHDHISMQFGSNLYVLALEGKGQKQIVFFEGESDQLMREILDDVQRITGFELRRAN